MLKKSIHSKKYCLPIIASIVPLLSYADDNRNSFSSLEEIIVTARRAEEGIQSVPVSITAFDAKLLSENSITTPEDLQLSTPGVYLSGGSGRQNVLYTIRGQSNPDVAPGRPDALRFQARRV